MTKEKTDQEKFALLANFWVFSTVPADVFFYRPRPIVVTSSSAPRVHSVIDLEESVLLVLSGRIRELHDTPFDDKARSQALLEVHVERSIIGLDHYLTKQPASHVALRTLARTHYMRVPYSVMDDFMQWTPFAQAVSRYVASELVSMKLKFVKHVTGDVRDRVYDALDLSNFSRENPKIVDKVSRSDLALRVGASREMVSRLIADLTDSGILIETHKGGRGGCR